MPWKQLEEKYREANRELARRRDGFLNVLDGNGNVARRYIAQFAPAELIVPSSPYQLSKIELERIAEVEHDNWKADREKAGWRLGDPSQQANAPKASPTT